MSSIRNGRSPSKVSQRFLRAALTSIIPLMFSAPTWALDSPYSRTFAVSNTKVTCTYTVSGVSVSTARVASAKGSIDCRIPSGSPGAGTVLRPSNSSMQISMRRNNTAFSTDALTLDEVGPFRPQLVHTKNATPSTCTRGTSYTWRGVFVSSFTLKLDYNGATLTVPEIVVDGPSATWAAASTSCNK